MAAKTNSTKVKGASGAHAKPLAAKAAGKVRAKDSSPQPKSQGTKVDSKPAAKTDTRTKFMPSPKSLATKQAPAGKGARRPAADARHASKAKTHALKSTEHAAHKPPVAAMKAATHAAPEPARPHPHPHRAVEPSVARQVAPAAEHKVHAPVTAAPLALRPAIAPVHRPQNHIPGGVQKRHHHGFHHSGQLPRDVIERNAVVKVDPNKKKTLQRHGFRTSEYVVYPSHGVGKIVAIEEQVVAGHALELFVINFEQEKMTLRVPTAKLAAVGMRKLSEDGIVKRAMETLKGRARVKRTMWSRRAQEYENKINSGDLVSISEVVRDLYRAETQPEQSYSERQLFEAALDRMSREIAAIEKLDERGAVQKITEVLSKSARGRAATKAAEDAANEAGEGQAA